MNVFFMGQRVPEPLDHAVIKPSINAITGHKPGDISEEHYLLLQDDLPLLKRHLDEIDFPFLRRIRS